MGQVLYRKYRPRKLSEVSGQEHITSTLSRALNKQQLSHAYLFTGPKGVGKTTVARILAHEINLLPYDGDSPHIDIIEIDAASNRRIDEIRELRERVYIAPSLAKYKVYIIDEVHMLTREAFNALLKTLEEPPEHVIFILATTDAHKLPETIISRTQRYSFKPINAQTNAERLAVVAKQEKIKASPEALELIAQHAQGSLRDSLSLLDQARSHTEDVSAETIRRLLGLVPSEALNKLLELSLNGQSAASLMNGLSELFDQGYQAETIASQLSQIIRHQLINDQLAEPETGLELLAKLIELPSSSNPERYLEISLLSVKPSEPKPKLAKVEIKPTEAEQTDEQLESKPPLKAKAKVQLNKAIWLEVLKTLRKKHNTLYGVVRMAEPHFDKPGKLELSFAFEFHKKRLSEAANKQRLIAAIKELTGQEVSIECHIDKAAKPMVDEPATDETSPPDQHLSTVSSIFNGAELLES